MLLATWYAEYANARTDREKLVVECLSIKEGEGV
ncbi:MAG: hypothetical protein ACI9F2_000318, partial [Lysobacterales bacterium]